MLARPATVARWSALVISSLRGHGILLSRHALCRLPRPAEPSLGVTFGMPLPPHVFDPPFNIVRCSHAVLRVRDLDASRRFYEDDRRPGGRARRQRCALPARHGGAQSPFARPKAGRRAERSGWGSRSRARQISTARRSSSPSGSCRPSSSRCRSRDARCTPPIATATGSSSTSRWTRPSACCSSTAATRLPAPAHRPLQLLRARRAGARSTSTPRSASA